MIPILPFLKNDLIVLEKNLPIYLKTPNAATNQIIEHVFASGGKRLRPSLFLLTCHLIGYEGSFKFPMAAVCEYIHTASLLHDDVIDNSTLRRNKPTINSIWGDETAVLSGDLIYSTACRLMVQTRSLDLIDCFAECIRSMSEGELFQLELLWKENVSLNQYETLVYGKTAVLFEACCKTPCYLHKLPPEFIQALSSFGRNLGFAFQIIDDCLDYSGKKEIVGKPLVKDLFEGKMTLPLLMALESKNNQLQELVRKFFATVDISQKEVSTLVQLVLENEGLSKAMSIAKDYVNMAKESLENFKNLSIKEGCFISQEVYENMLSLADFSIERKT